MEKKYPAAKPFDHNSSLTDRKKAKQLMNEDEIIKRCQRSDMSAYKMIYERYKQPLLHTSQQMLGQLEDAEDAVQLTFIKLHRGIKNFRFESKFSSYLFRILINVCFDMLKKRKRMKLQTIEEFEPAYISKSEEMVGINEAIAKLPKQMRACFVLFIIEEFKQSEIAAILNLSEGGVKSNIFRAKVQLRKMLSEG
jgi:RNA polymerase sigma-70 factor (ECF subfamily)